MATSEFGKAFAAARAAGDKKFTFKGKDYTTDMAKSAAPKAATAVAPKTASGNTMFDSGSSKTPYQMSQDMKAKNAAIPKPKAMTFQESMDKVGADDKARNAARTIKGNADAKSRGDAVKNFFKKAGSRLTTVGYDSPDYNPPAKDMPTERKGGAIKSKKGTTMKKMASGGSFRSSANGIAKKGKTKGTQVKMAAGGKMKGC